jgi:hypothetical protein
VSNIPLQTRQNARNILKCCGQEWVLPSSDPISVSNQGRCRLCMLGEQRHDFDRHN